MSQSLLLQGRLRDFNKDTAAIASAVVRDVFSGSDLEEAKNLGRSEGYNQGYQDAQKTLEGQVNFALQKIDSHLEEWTRLKEHDTQVNVDLLILCLTQVFSVLKEPLVVKEMEKVFLQFFQQMKSKRPLTILSHPRIVPALQEQAMGWSRGHDLTFEGDEKLDVSDVVIQWPEGEYKLGLSSAIQAVIEKVQLIAVHGEEAQKENLGSLKNGEENV